MLSNLTRKQGLKLLVANSNSKTLSTATRSTHRIGKSRSVIQRRKKKFIQDNYIKKGKPVPKYIPKIKNWKLVTGDLVEMQNGSDIGSQGKILKVNRRLELVKIEGLNLKKDEDTDELFEDYVSVNHVRIVDPITKLACTMGFKKDEQGNGFRYSKETGNIIPKPPPFVRKNRLDGFFDTAPDDVLEVTYFPDEEFMPDVVNEPLLIGEEDEEEDKLPENEEKLPEIEIKEENKKSS